jgi:hypothetical protein
MISCLFLNMNGLMLMLPVDMGFPSGHWMWTLDLNGVNFLFFLIPSKKYLLINYF